MKKRCIALLLSFAILLTTGMIPVYAAGEEDFAVKVSDITATAGDTRVAVDILLQNNPGIAGFSFCVDYDKDNLTLVEAQICLEDGYQVITQIDQGLNLAWTGFSDYSADGKIATLYFDVPEDAHTGNAPVKIVYRSGYDSFYDRNEQDCTVQTVNGKVRISGAEDTEAFSVSVGTATARPGDNDICIPISLQNNPGITGFSFCVDYPSDCLTLEKAEIKIDYGYKVVAHPAGTGINLAWTDTSGLKTDGVIAELYFSVKESASPEKAYIDLTFRDNYDSFYAFRNGTEEDISVSAYSGYVNITPTMAAQVTTDGITQEYATIEEALLALADGSVLQLLKDVTGDIDTDQQISLDLNGCNIDGNLTAAYAVVYDSQTDDYTVNNGKGYGVITGTVSGVVSREGYIALRGVGISFHKVDVALDKLVLKPGDVGLYYTGSFQYDEVVAENLEACGITMSNKNQEPVADDSDPTSLYTTSGNSVLLKNIMNTWNSKATNRANARKAVYARAYLKLKDSRILYSDSNAANLQTMVEAVDAKAWSGLTNAQKDGLKALYTTYSDVMDSWAIENIKNYAA